MRFQMRMYCQPCYVLYSNTVQRLAADIQGSSSSKAVGHAYEYQLQTLRAARGACAPEEGGKYARWLRRGCEEIRMAEGALLEETIGIENLMMTSANAYLFAELGCIQARGLCPPFDTSKLPKQGEKLSRCQRCKSVAWDLRDQLRQRRGRRCRSI